jgi:hypothetical protein
MALPADAVPVDLHPIASTAMSESFSAMTRRQAAADRFARATQITTQQSNSLDAAAVPMEANSSLFDYDGFLGSRASNPTSNTLPTAAAAQPAHPSLSSKLRFHAGEFGVPIPPANARVANRRHYYLKHHLQPQEEEGSASRASAAAASVAGLGLSLPARSAAPSIPSSSLSTSTPPLHPDYFDDDEMERRRPALYFEYIGRYERGEGSSRKGEDEDSEEDPIDVATRRGERADDSVEEESKMSDTAPPSRSSKSSKSDKSREKAARKNPAAHLPENLSSLLLANYDKEQRKQRREKEESKAAASESRKNNPPTAAATNAHPAIRNAQPRVREPDAMLDSDESELSDAEEAHPTAHPTRPPAVLFQPDDGITTDPTDGSDLREAGPTASREAAEFYRLQVEDDMDVRRSREQEERREREEWERNRRRHTNENQMMEADEQTDRSTAVDATASTLRDSPSPPATASLRQDFLHLMHQLFLDGYDSAYLSYAEIDENEEYEDLEERARREQEEYFDDATEVAQCEQTRPPIANQPEKVNTAMEE